MLLRLFLLLRLRIPQAGHQLIGVLLVDLSVRLAFVEVLVVRIKLRNKVDAVENALIRILVVAAEVVVSVSFYTPVSENASFSAKMSLRCDGPLRPKKHPWDNYSFFDGKCKTAPKKASLAPNLIGDLLYKEQFRPLFLRSQLVADLAGRETALRA